MKIAYIVPSLAKAGPNIVVQTLVYNLLSQYKNEIETIDIYYFDEKTKLDFPCRTIHITQKSVFPFDDYDIIHSHGFRPDKYICKHREEIKCAKVISTVHQDIFSYFRFAYNRLVAYLFTPLWLFYLRKHDAVVPISNKIHSLYNHKLKNLVGTIYNGVELDSDENTNFNIIKQIEDFRDGKTLIIGTYANITKIKGLEQLINLLKLRSDIGLIIIGEGKEKKNLQQMVTRCNLENNVLFLTFLDAPYKYLKYMDIYAMPSRSEGFGLAAVEGTLSKIPVVASAIDIFKELFRDDEVAFFELDDINSLNQAISNVQMYRESMIKKAYERSIQVYTGERMAHGYFKLYKSLVQNK